MRAQSMSTPELSVVVPFRDEAGSLPALHRRLAAVLEETGRPFEILYIDDGSRDGSYEILRRACGGDGRAHGVRLAGRHGKSAALAEGLRRARGGILVTLDADLQDRPEEIPRLLAALEQGWDMVVAWRIRREDDRICRVSSWLFNTALRLAAGSSLHDHNSGMKAFRRSVVQSVLPYGERHRFIALMALWAGFSVTEIPVEHAPRLHGRSKYGPGRAFGSLLDFVSLWVIHRYLHRPLHFFGLLGGGCLGAGLLINVYIAALWFRLGHINQRYPLLLLGILATLVGLQLLCTGLHAEMIVRLSPRVVPSEAETFGGAEDEDDAGETEG